MALELNGTTGVSLVQDGVVTAADLASGAITSAALPTGSVLQVVYAESTTETVISVGSYSDSSLSASITPSSTSSKILVLVSQSLQHYRGDASGGQIRLNLLRGGTQIDETNLALGFNGVDTEPAIRASVSIQSLDSPSTTSATTYKTQLRPNSTSGGDTATAQPQSSRSSITLMEIAG